MRRALREAYYGWHWLKGFVTGAGLVLVAVLVANSGSICK